MKKFAQILYNKAHWIFEAEEKPEFAPNIVLVDITGNAEVQEGWDYDPETGVFTEPVFEPEPMPGPIVPIEQIAEETLLETKYQTLLLEMMI
ncbi:hypothetical protein MKY41_11360 [Sporosarcina sp. FSL W7-1349]|uniref:hypothetical protein n=1 Tax=Sporosarcina sp. FSL W7-1349 TaxID=2921561 RepID=UPI0030F60202